jgi:hypothetical protein
MPNGTRMISAQCIARVRQQAELQDPIGIVRRAAYHAAGNYRALTTMAGQLLTVAADRNLAQLDEKLYFEVFAPPDPRKRRVAATRP